MQNSKRFITFLLFFSFFIMLFSGIILYIMPHGRVAYWTDWRFFNLNKDDWSSVHTNFSYLFMILSLMHIYFNRKPIYHYLKKYKKELFFSLIFSIILFGGVILNLPPFKSVMDIGEKIKLSWKDNEIAPKIPHGELLSLKKLCKRLKIEPDIALIKLHKNNIKVKSINEKIRDIAKKNQVKPIDIYLIIKKK